MINGATKVPALFNHLVEAILRGQMCNDPPTLTESLQIIGGLTVELYQKAIVTLHNSGHIELGCAHAVDVLPNGEDTDES